MDEITRYKLAIQIRWWIKLGEVNKDTDIKDIVKLINDFELDIKTLSQTFPPA